MCDDLFTRKLDPGFVYVISGRVKRRFWFGYRWEVQRVCTDKEKAKEYLRERMAKIDERNPRPYGNQVHDHFRYFTTKLDYGGQGHPANTSDIFHNEWSYYD